LCFSEEENGCNQLFRMNFSTKDILLEIKNLSLSFKTANELKSALHDISFSVHKGQTIGVVGESGSGKSITSLSIMRLLTSKAQIDHGKILYTDQTGYTRDLIHASSKAMESIRGKEIGMVFQEPMTSLNPSLTCGFQIEEAIRKHLHKTSDDAKKNVIDLFEQVQLPRASSLFSSYPHELSGGQKQRVMIAMAISCNPSLLIADEPTTALDVTVQKNILELLKQLQKERNMGIIFITHDLGVTAEMADEVVVMHKGKIVEKGITKKILINPEHSYTKGLMACRPPENKRYIYLPTVSDFISGNGEDLLDEKNIYTTEKRSEKHKTIYTQPPLLEVKNLFKTYTKRKSLWGEKEQIHAVKNISFPVYKGETLGLVGESGCGKTTLGRCLLRLIEPSSGQILFQGNDITHWSVSALRKFRKQLQIIFQDPYSSLNPKMKIGDAIVEPMKVHQLHKNDTERKKKVIELLERVGLNEEHFHRYPHEFSGGQRQRIVIARALACEPSFVICDESVSALDVSVQAQVLNLLNELKNEFNLTYIFISHDLSVVKYMSDRMMVMNRGELVEMGDPDIIYPNPSSDYTRKLINAIPRINF
jgi:peptide/nickel transport system ATP-binding protein